MIYGLVVRSLGFTGGVTASFKALRRGEISTNERFRDLRTKAVMRVWVDSGGGRHYIVDDQP